MYPENAVSVHPYGGQYCCSSRRIIGALSLPAIFEAPEEICIGTALIEKYQGTSGQKRLERGTAFSVR